MASNDLVALIADIFNSWTDDVQERVNNAVKEVADATKDRIKNASPSAHGDYSRGWTVKKTTSQGKTICTIHNKQYYLTHLLEHGHVIRNQAGTYGRTPAQVHIRPAEEWANAEIERRIRQAIEEASE